MTTFLETVNLTKTFGGVAAIFNLSFATGAGSVFSIIGPNGAGKTTLFNLLSGIYQPTSGAIRFQGQSLIGLTPHQIANLGISRTFQTPQIFFNMSVLENTLVGCHRHGTTGFLSAALRLPHAVKESRLMEEQARDALHFCGLQEWIDREADSLPYGALKRLEVSRALTTRPTLLLMDEPAAGLNDSETKEMGALIQKICATGVSVMLVEHNMDLVMEISDNLLVLNHGEYLAQGTPAQIQENPKVIKAYLGSGEEDDEQFD
ncbi:MAG: ABC transporter ATP-binding protein [Magnetococcales bacterium]|nr:ABC transporter ATP-binding protein [Magnetococcales bacterium]